MVGRKPLYLTPVAIFGNEHAARFLSPRFGFETVIPVDD
jgi:hypothetical protein